MEIKIINRQTGEDPVFTRQAIADFLLEHLDQYGDERKDILKCLDYVFAENRGGNIILGIEDGAVAGAVVLNDTGMGGYIPENILVYIAVHRKFRGKGLGKQLMEAAIRESRGDIALHVEPQNPAAALYRKLGFTNKYLEMRYKKEPTA